MAELVEISKIDELKDGAMKAVSAAGREIILARAGDKYYAADNRCPHMGGELSEGKLEGSVVTCPRHGSQFDLSDGHVVRWLKKSGLLETVSKALKSPRPLVTYKVTVKDKTILVEI